MKYTTAFVILATQLLSATAFHTSTSPRINNVLVLNAVELTPEPEGGEELTSVSTMAGSRMKNMGEASGVTGEGGQQAYKYWLTAEVAGALVKEINTRVLKDASKKANFPGFRKVCIHYWIFVLV